MQYSLSNSETVNFCWGTDMFLIFYFLGADPAILLVESSSTGVYIKNDKQIMD